MPQSLLTENVAAILPGQMTSLDNEFDCDGYAQNVRDNDCKQ